MADSVEQMSAALAEMAGGGGNVYQTVGDKISKMGHAYSRGQLSEAERRKAIREIVNANSDLLKEGTAFSQGASQPSNALKLWAEFYTSAMGARTKAAETQTSAKKAAYSFYDKVQPNVWERIAADSQIPAGMPGWDSEARGQPGIRTKIHATMGMFTYGDFNTNMDAGQVSQKFANTIMPSIGDLLRNGLAAQAQGVAGGDYIDILVQDASLLEIRAEVRKRVEKSKQEGYISQKVNTDRVVDETIARLKAGGLGEDYGQQTNESLASQTKANRAYFEKMKVSREIMLQRVGGGAGVDWDQEQKLFQALEDQFDKQPKDVLDPEFRYEMPWQYTDLLEFNKRELQRLRHRDPAAGAVFALKEAHPEAFMYLKNALGFPGTSFVANKRGAEQLIGYPRATDKDATNAALAITFMKEAADTGLPAETLDLLSRVIVKELGIGSVVTRARVSLFTPSRLKNAGATPSTVAALENTAKNWLVNREFNLITPSGPELYKELRDEFWEENKKDADTLGMRRNEDGSIDFDLLSPGETMWKAAVSSWRSKQTKWDPSTKTDVLVPVDEEFLNLVAGDSPELADSLENLVGFLVGPEQTGQKPEKDVVEYTSSGTDNKLFLGTDSFRIEDGTGAVLLSMGTQDPGYTEHLAALRKRIDDGSLVSSSAEPEQITFTGEELGLRPGEVYSYSGGKYFRGEEELSEQKGGQVEAALRRKGKSFGEPTSGGPVSPPVITSGGPVSPPVPTALSAGVAAVTDTPSPAPPAPAPVSEEEVIPATEALKLLGIPL